MADKRKNLWGSFQTPGLLDQLSGFLDLHKSINPKKEALKIAAVIASVGVLWVLLSDKILHFFISDPEVIHTVELVKGWAYILLSSAAFYFIIYRKMKLFKNAIDQIFQGYKELVQTHEELITMDEELSQQFEELEANQNALLLSEQRYKLSVEGANDGIWDWDLIEGKYFFSTKWKNSLGYDQVEFDDTIEVWRSLLHPEDRDRCIELLNSYLQTRQGIYENTYRFRCSDDSYRWILSRGKGIWDNDGNPQRMAGSHTDITDYMNLQENLRREKEFSESIIQNAPMLILLFNTDGRIVVVNPYAEKLIGFPASDLIGKRLSDFNFVDQSPEVTQNQFRQIMNGYPLTESIVGVRHLDGTCHTLLWSSSLLQGANDAVDGIVLIGMDITERREMENKLYSLAYYDPLTRLPNREMLRESMQRRIRYSQKHKKQFAFLYLDIDNLKHVNDTLGHDEGDRLIMHVAHILQESIEAPGFVARFGTDEFAIILPETSSPEEITPLVEYLLNRIKEPWITGGKKFHTSASLGIVLFPENARDYSTLLQNADTALYHMKSNGKNGFIFFTDQMRETALQQIQTSNQLLSAIKNQEFLLYYQPQIDLSTGKMIGVEALIRWRHPERGFVPPMEFIPLAESTGCITQIEEWVFLTACMQQQKWERMGFTDFKMSVNLSGKRLLQNGLVEKIQQTLKESQVCPQNIELEITETAILSDLEQGIFVLNELKRLGLTIDLDDFGTGYSSLTYLQKLPIDILKIDREFIRSVQSAQEESFIYKSIVDLAHNMGMRVVTEGVETLEQVHFIRRHGCDIAQGYYYSRPVPANEIESMLKDSAMISIT